MRLLLVVKVFVISAYGERHTVRTSHTTYGVTAFHMPSLSFHHPLMLQLGDFCVRPSVWNQHLLRRWRLPCQVSCYLFRLHFVAHKATGSDLLWRSIFIWHAVSVFLLVLEGTWSSFPLLRFGGGRWLHSRIFCLCVFTEFMTALSENSLLFAW